MLYFYKITKNMIHLFRDTQVIGLMDLTNVMHT